jgi:polysaccharide biosynthesis transport protein
MNETTDATAIFAPLWRRKWLILAVAVVVGVASYAYYKRAQHIYQATTQVFLGAANEEAAPGEKASTKGQAVSVANQAAIINTIIVEQVHHQLRKQNNALVLRASKVRAKAAEKSPFITITVEAHTARGAVLLANATAQAYIRRQHANHQLVIERAIAITRRQLRRIEASSAPVVASKSTGSKGKSAAPASTPSTSSILQSASLNSRINQLEANLSAAGAQQIKPAKIETTVLISPKPRQNALFGFVLGLFLAAIAAYVMSRFDRRLRTLAAAEAIYGSPILAALPKVKRPIVQREGEPAPSKFLLEPLRRLHSALQLGDIAKQTATPSRVILFTSADAGDGKSTLVADLALVQRDAGARVAVLEANFRRPVQARLLGVDGTHGLAAVLAGAVPVEDALQRVRPEHPSAYPQSHASSGSVASTIEATGTGSLAVLAGGGPVANPPALLAQATMADLVRSLAGDFDYVLIDAPSPLQLSDAMPLLNHVDGIVIVGRLGHTREMSAQRLVQLLTQAGAPVLGTVANCVPRKEIERYGLATPNGRVWPASLTR